MLEVVVVKKKGKYKPTNSFSGMLSLYLCVSDIMSRRLEECAVSGSFVLS